MVEEIGNVLHLQLLYSPQLHQKLATRNTNYSCSLKAQKGGCNQELYRSLAWQVPIEDSNVDSVALQRQVKELSEKMASLKKDRKESGQSSNACLCVCMCVYVCPCMCDTGAMVFEPASLNMYNTTCLHMQFCCNCNHHIPSLHLHLFSLLAALL